MKQKKAREENLMFKKSTDMELKIVESLRGGKGNKAS